MCNWNRSLEFLNIKETSLYYKSPTNQTYWWNFGFLALYFLVIQTITGILLVMYDKWWIGFLHANGAFFFMCLFIYLLLIFKLLYMNHIFNILKRFTMIIIQYFYNIIRIVYSIGDGIINIIGLKDAVNGETLDFLLIKSNNNTEDEILKRGRFLAPWVSWIPEKDKFNDSEGSLYEQNSEEEEEGEDKKENQKKHIKKPKKNNSKKKE